MEATTNGIQAALGAGDLACVGLVERHSQRSDAYDKPDPAIDAVQTGNPGASAAAARLESSIVESGPAALRGLGSSGRQAAPPRGAGPENARRGRPALRRADLGGTELHQRRHALRVDTHHDVGRELLRHLPLVRSPRGDD